MVTIGIASVPARKEMLLKTVHSLIGQCGQMFIALNGYSEIPQELSSNSKIHCDLLDNSLKDSAKFLHVGEVWGYYLGCDDDLIYPSTYSKYMISKVKEHNSIVTLHGRRFTRPVRALRRGFTLNYHCLHSYDYDTELDLGGTGVMCFDTDQFKLSINDFPIAGMADVWASKKAHEQGIRIMGVAHRNSYLRYMYPPNKTLWELSRDDSVQTKILQSFLK